MLASTPATDTTTVLEGLLPSEQATRELAAALSALLAPGDVVALSGGLGSGKTTFARALIRHLAGDNGLEVPSPTFTLVQTYELPKFPVAHLDLYRVGSESELAELGLAELTEDAVTLVEWPERAGSALPPPSYTVALSIAPAEGAELRHVKLTLPKPPPASITRLLGFHRFMQEAGFGQAERARMQGDASTRIYDRLALAGRSAVLMIAPRRPDGPPVKDGKPYSAIAHLAEDVTPFVALARGLRERGFSAPAVYAADLNDGLLILEDLGTEGVVAGEPPQPIEERYAAGVDVLVALHAQPLPDTLPVAPSVTYRIPPYDIDALLIEVELLLEWYLPQQERVIAEEQKEAFRALWRETLAPAIAAPPTWILRDYHSPNMLWLPEREGIARVGLLDFQDAVMGPAAYDVVSLLQDARIDVPVLLEDTLVTRYMKGRRLAHRDFDMGQFVELYGVMGAQRATKILGIFARLAKRDGKPQYLRHQPRVWRNLRRSLAHPALAKLKAWFDLNVSAPRHP
ncbi:MAG: tRNA (adenosine(37)-N6)-threonylcarbamoyltransferase complex ATPase subunit type 1 TsaE [Variibacter sp.]|nr:tRNA (adenosine(37)-N6)-threonylcarbamoyltransferase complex ATPase subunit type 1 TsaE [Variibacter sp.]